MIGRSLADLMSEMGHKRTNQSAPVPTFVRYAPNSGQTGAQPDCPLCAKGSHGGAFPTMEKLAASSCQKAKAPDAPTVVGGLKR
jgi:hypothetical protein